MKKALKLYHQKLSHSIVASISMLALITCALAFVTFFMASSLGFASFFFVYFFIYSAIYLANHQGYHTPAALLLFLAKRDEA